MLRPLETLVSIWMLFFLLLHSSGTKGSIHWLDCTYHGECSAGRGGMRYSDSRGMGKSLLLMTVDGGGVQRQ